MKRAIAISLCFLGFATGNLRADQPVYIFDPLPTPLKLPPGLIETLPLNHDGSFFGDQLRAVGGFPWRHAGGRSPVWNLR